MILLKTWRYISRLLTYLLTYLLQHRLSTSKGRSHCVRRHLHAQQELLMHWHHSSTSQLCIYGDGPLHDYTLY